MTAHSPDKALTQQIRAGRLLLAVADDDLPQLTSILREAAGEEAGIITLLTAVCSVAAESCRAVAGDQWREVLVTAMHELEINAITEESR
jgi:hypothetical protein